MAPLRNAYRATVPNHVRQAMSAAKNLLDLTVSRPRAFGFGPAFVLCYTGLTYQMVEGANEGDTFVWSG